VIHTVGPIWNGGGEGEDDLLASCYRNVLQLASENGARSIAFPSISTGAYRFPMERATRIAIATVGAELTRRSDIERAVFVCFGAEALSIYRRILGEISGRN
jgi:O-acetyl-ADP-ribose deacetylase (regulator of RNase III)